LAIIIAILMFGVIVLIHEFGHFIVAVKAGILVEEFAIGMGPKLFGVQKGDTLYSLRLFPIGGFCKMLGEDEANDDTRAFNNKSVWARIAVISAGVFMNFVLALIIFVGISAVNGMVEPVINEVIPGSPAETAQLRKGDRIVRINGRKINIYDDLSYELSSVKDMEVRLTVKRDGAFLDKTVVPVYIQEENRYILGFYPQRKAPLTAGESTGEYTKASLTDTISDGYYTMLFLIRVNLEGIVQLFTFKADMSDVSGPIGIVTAIGETYDASMKLGVSYTVKTVLTFVAMLSASIGLFNLLPLPALDGGRLIFLFVEAVRRKPVPPDKEGMVHFIGLVMLMILAVFVAFSDIRKLL